MGESSGRKLMVQVCNAKNLMPKDGQGTASAYAIVDFDGQRRRTNTKSRDLNPQWDETLEFIVHDKDSMASETLEVNLYNDKKTGKRSTFLGKVKLSGSTFVKSGSETVAYYPLEKRSVFSQIKGELGLKVWYVDDPPEAENTGEEKTESAPPAEEKPPGNLEGEIKEDEPEKNKPDEDKPKEEPTAEKPKEEVPEETASPKQEVSNPSIVQTEKPKQGNERHHEVLKCADLNVSNGELRSLSSDRSRSAYDLVDPMPFLYVRVVKTKRARLETGSTVYANLSIGTRSVKTKSETESKDWDQVFAFDKEGLNSTSLEVSVWSEVKEGEEKSETCLGTVSFDLQEVPRRVPPDSPLAPQWYTLESETTPGNDVMLAVWIGSQADEAFQEAWLSDSGGLIPETRAKVYLSPKLWYLRLTVIQTQDLKLASETEAKVRNPELCVKAQLGAQVFKTGRTSSGSANPTWNEDLVLVAAEPFQPFLDLIVEDVSNSKTVGHAKVHVATIERRTDDQIELKSRWFNLYSEDESRSYAGRIHVRVCMEGGYHVIDETAHVTSDVRASAKQLTKPPIGLLEVGIRGATNLLPVKTIDGTHGTTDAFVVAKYGPKWVRTRTIMDQFNPRWNEQYTWDVYDPCTVLTIGVFDNGRYKTGEDGKPNRDCRIGKVRVRLSTLETNRVYANSYSLVVLLPGGAKRMGEIEIAVRFSCSSWLSLIQAYASPILPRMHYVRPFGPAQQDILRQTAMKIVTARLARSEPALGQEVVQFMLDSDTHMWGMRRSKANWFRVVRCLSRAATLLGWVDGIRTWVHPPMTLLVHMLLAATVLCPYLVLPTVFLCAFLILLLRFRYRQRVPGNMDMRMSYVDMVSLDELDEEFDGFPTTRPAEVVKMRYDRVRALAGRAQTLLGDVAAQGERLEALFSWRDPRATGIFAVVCLMMSLLFYAVPFRGLVLVAGFYYLRHPRFRDDMPSIPANFFRRLPSFSDQIM
ncbi:protein QUIRKY [Vigna radiata var. radiata]|uniref:Protein QUIRKY n=1 Tax=Vigna radiata var. radiata TaxID=3916 RepID=A0A1S3U9A0_VIGRR|nr:protein QUIRKY [Vigna radiata var. radiata]